jgi:hypothetical protein
MSTTYYELLKVAKTFAVPTGHDFRIFAKTEPAAVPGAGSISYEAMTVTATIAGTPVTFTGHIAEAYEVSGGASIASEFDTTLGQGTIAYAATNSDTRGDGDGQRYHPIINVKVAITDPDPSPVTHAIIPVAWIQYTDPAPSTK